MGESPRWRKKIPSQSTRLRGDGRSPRHNGRSRDGTGLADTVTMSHIMTRRRVLGAVEHVLAIVAGIILMVLGLGLSVTMIMLPVGLIVGLAGLGMFIAGMCVRFDWI